MPLGEAVCPGDGDAAAGAAGVLCAAGLAVAAGVPAGEGPGAFGVLAGVGDPA